MSRPCLFPPELALLLTPASVRALQDAFQILEGTDESDPLAVARALHERTFAAAATKALYRVARLATAYGFEGSLEGARDLALPSRRWLRLAPADLAVALVCAAARGDVDARRIVARAGVRVARHFAPRASYEILLTACALPKSPEVLQGAGKRVHGASFVAGWQLAGDDGVLRAVVVHRAPATRVVTFARGKVVARTRRPLACDLVAWDASRGDARGRVTFDLARPATLTDWTDALSAAAGDPTLFSDGPAYTLKSLHEGGAKWLEELSLPRGVRSVAVVACELDDGTRHRTRGEHALRDLHVHVGKARGYLQRATLRLALDDEAIPVDATIELPGKLVVSDPQYEPEIYSVMEACQITLPGLIPDDLVSFSPWVHPEWRWVVLLGEGVFARAVARGLLTRTPSKSAAASGRRRYGTLLRAFDLEGEPAKYAAGEDFSVRAHTLPLAPLVVWKLDLKKLAAALCDAARLTPMRLRDVPREVLAIGELRVKSRRVRFFALMEAVRAEDIGALTRRLRRLCKRGVPVLLTPKARRFDGEIDEVHVTPEEHMGCADLSRVVQAAATDLEIEDDIEPWRFGSVAAPLVVVRERDEIWLGTVRLDLTENQRDVVVALSLEGGAFMRAGKLGNKVSAGATIPDQVVRRAMLGFEERIRASFADASVPLPEEWATKLVLSEKAKGYRLGVGFVVV